MAYQHVLGTVGGIILIMIGIGSLRTKPHVELRGAPLAKGLGSIFFQSVIFTFSCPSTIVFFSSQFATAQQIFTTPGMEANVALISGVAASVAAWFTLVVLTVNFIRTRIDDSLRKLNILSGLVIGALGIKFVYTHLMIILFS